MKNSQWIIHTIAECQDCGKKWEGHLTARRLAYGHAYVTGHKVTGEQAKVFRYN